MEHQITKSKNLVLNVLVEWSVCNKPWKLIICELNEQQQDSVYFKITLTRKLQDLNLIVRTEVNNAKYSILWSILSILGDWLKETFFKKLFSGEL